MGRVALYANVGTDLTHYDVDVAGAALTRTLSAGLSVFRMGDDGSGRTAGRITDRRITWLTA